jgi:1,4-dihydroxy-2-naphthoate octaprenyltransferase
LAFARLGRPRFLLNSLLLVTLGLAVAVHQGRQLEWGGWVLTQLFAWCTHLMTHYCNEYFDLEADRLNSDPTGQTGGSRVLVSGVLSPQVALSASMVLLFADAVLIVAMPGVLTRLLALLGAALAWFYTAPPMRLNYRALGEVDCALVLNVIWPVLAYRSQAPGLPAVLLALTFVLFVMQVARMTVMNLADHDSDLLAGKRTLANVLPSGLAVRLYAGLQAAGFAALVILLGVGIIPLAPGLLLMVTALLSVWTVRLLRLTSLDDAAGMGRVAWWASTQISAAVYAVTLGLLISPAARTADARPGLALSAALLASFAVLFTFLQLRGLRRLGRRQIRGTSPRP